MPAARAMFDPSATFKVRRAFTFGGLDLVPGDRFSAQEMQASPRKVRNLWEARKIDVATREELAMLTEPSPASKSEGPPTDAVVEPLTGGWFLIKHPSLPPEGKKVQGKRSVEEFLQSLQPKAEETPPPPPAQTEPSQNGPEF